MFKRKANTKKLDLNAETEHIVTLASAQPSLSPLHPEPPKQVYKHKAKTNSITIDLLEKADTTQDRPTFSSTLPHQEIEDCFSEIRKWKQPQTQDQAPPPPPALQTFSFVVNPDPIEIEGYDNEQRLEVVIDEDGGFSPISDGEERNEREEDYEDALIRKTLTKQNYERVSMRGGPSLQELKRGQAEDSLLGRIGKVTANAVHKTIARDLQAKRKKLQNLQSELSYITTRSKEKAGQMQKKEERLKSMEQEMEKLKTVVEYLFYYGDRVEQFNMESILALAETVQNRRMAKQKPAGSNNQEQDQEEEDDDDEDYEVDEDEGGYS